MFRLWLTTDRSGGTLIAVPSQAAKEALLEASLDYASQLPGSPAEEYLIDTRGLTGEVIEQFQLGFVGEPHPGDDIFKGRISIPFLTKTGPVAAQYRNTGNHEPRFLSRGSTARPFNVSVLLHPHRRVYICEGMVDTMTVATLGAPAVGFPGVDTWGSSPVFPRAFRNRKVVVLAQGDDDGQSMTFANKILRDVEDCDVILFEGEDVNSFYIKYGHQKLREKIGLK